MKPYAKTDMIPADVLASALRVETTDLGIIVYEPGDTVPVLTIDPNLDHNAPILAQIDALETKQARSMRENLLGDATAMSRIQSINDQIVALRAALL